MRILGQKSGNRSPVRQKRKTNTDLLEKILTNNFGSKEFFINKAIGWALRIIPKPIPTG